MAPRVPPLVLLPLALILVLGGLVDAGTPGSAAAPAPAPLAAAPPLTPRSVPAYVTPTAVQARTQAYGGRVDVAFDAAPHAGAQPLWGDWWGNGTETLAFFRNGTWVFQRSNVNNSNDNNDRAGRPDTSPPQRFGIRGDRPVVGDWNGDGRTDIGVKRGRTWYLAIGLNLSRAAAPRVWRSFRLGSPRSLPVAGRWEGGRADGVGAFDRGYWGLKTLPRAGSKIHRFRFGGPKGSLHRSRDVPVVGDWSASGRDNLGIVRGSVWRLRMTPGGRAQRRVVPRPAGSIPVAWTTPTGSNGQLCPTMGTTFVPTNWKVAPPAATRKASFGAVSQPGGAATRTALQRVERFLLGTRYDATWGRQSNRLYADVRGSDKRAEYAIRLPAMSAATVAISVATGAHDDATVGRSRAQAVAYVDFLLRSLACQHQSVSPGGWGRTWQSDHWSSLIGLAGWLLWDELNPQTRTYVASMMDDESRYLMSLPTAYWRDLQGRELPGREGNTAAEEVAWGVALMELAVQMNPSGRDADAFRAQAVQLATASYATPSDTRSARVVNGVPLRQRLQGYNALDDGTVVNHNRVHPDYMGNIQHLWWAADYTVLGGAPLPEAYLHNGALVYGALSTLEFDAGAPSVAGGGRRYVAPGGTIYRHTRADPNEIYFPDGTDWGLPRRAPFMSLDAHAITYGLVPPGAWSAEEALTAHAAAQLRLGDGSGASDGRTYRLNEAQAKEQDRYVGREEYAAQQVATAWLALVLGEVARPGLDTSTYLVPGQSSARRTPAPPPVRRVSP